jgi:hypothetical protein
VPLELDVPGRVLVGTSETTLAEVSAKTRPLLGERFDFAGEANGVETLRRRNLLRRLSCGSVRGRETGML